MTGFDVFMLFSKWLRVYKIVNEKQKYFFLDVYTFQTADTNLCYAMIQMFVCFF